MSKGEKEFSNTLQQTSDLRLPSLDGWRAVSILLVLIQHSTTMPGWPNMFKNFLFSSVGGVGVRFFFVISGFLITWLLIKEADKYGNICIKSFYVRRFLRILPVFCLYLLAVIAIQSFGNLTVTTKEYLIAGTFMSDLWKVYPPLAHLWSLGVEEKFYLFWPALFILFFQPNLKSLKVILIFTLILCPVLRGFVDTFHLENQFEVFNNHSILIIYDGLAIGCMGAILWSKYQILISDICKKNNFLVFIVGGILIVLPAVFWLVPLLKNLKPLQDTLQCSGFLILMLQSISNPTFFVYKLLNVRVITHIGVISYSIYIWMGIAELSAEHYGMTSHFFNEFPGWIIIVVLLAEISYNLVEAPLMGKKKTILTWLGLSR